MLNSHMACLWAAICLLGQMDSRGRFLGAQACQGRR